MENCNGPNENFIGTIGPKGNAKYVIETDGKCGCLLLIFDKEFVSTLLRV
jgi:hypothetical protein